MGIKIKIDGVKYAFCKDCGVYHKQSKDKKNQDQRIFCKEKTTITHK